MEKNRALQWALLGLGIARTVTGAPEGLPTSRDFLAGSQTPPAKREPVETSGQFPTLPARETLPAPSRRKNSVARATPVSPATSFASPTAVAQATKSLRAAQQPVAISGCEDGVPQHIVEASRGPDGRVVFSACNTVAVRWKEGDYYNGNNPLMVIDGVAQFIIGLGVASVDLLSPDGTVRSVNVKDMPFRR